VSEGILEAVILPPTEARRENLAKSYAPPVRAVQAFSSDPPLGFASRRMTVSLTLARDFLVIEKDESLGIPFDVQGEIVVTTDFTTERRIKITAKNLVMKKVAAKGGSIGTSAHIQ